MLPDVPVLDVGLLIINNPFKIFQSIPFTGFQVFARGTMNRAEEYQVNLAYLI